jgi:hypothetical protein
VVVFDYLTKSFTDRCFAVPAIANLQLGEVAGPVKVEMHVKLVLFLDAHHFESPF